MNCGANVLDDFLGEEVVDRDGNPVGTLACYWEHRQRNALLPKQESAILINHHFYETHPSTGEPDSGA